MRILVSLALFTAVSAVAFWGADGAFTATRSRTEAVANLDPRFAVVDRTPGYGFEFQRTMPDPVNALHVADETDQSIQGLVYVGMAGPGSVHRVSMQSIGVPMIISGGLGDMIRFGSCQVNRLALRDLDGDGRLDMLASTSQVHPRGRPKLCVFDATLDAPTLRAVARPDIKSSWSHSLGFLDRPGASPPVSVFSTFCGYGEVVEYRMEKADEAAGFASERLSWKVVGQLPTSGEWLEVADADNDGRDDVCVAGGFALNQAEILLYRSDAPGAPLRLEQRVSEDNRFGNVRFTVAALGSTGERDVLAWWCTDIAGGDAEVIRYRLGPDGIRERTVLAKGPAARLWSDDGQFTTGDLDGDGRAEVWFGTQGGQLWRYAPAVSPKLERVAIFKDSLGPIAIGPDFMVGKLRPALFLGWKTSIFRLDSPPPALAAIR